MQWIFLVAPRSRLTIRRFSQFTHTATATAIFLSVAGCDVFFDGATDITRFDPAHIPANVLLNVPDEGRLHVFDETPPTYQFNPPASGPHSPIPAETGFHCDQLPTEHGVHSLEHGFIVILFDPASPLSLPNQFSLRLLLQLAPVSPTFGNRKLVVTPYAGLQHSLCLVAWNRQLYLDFYDPLATDHFYRTYIDQGPEQEK